MKVEIEISAEETVETEESQKSRNFKEVETEEF